MEAGCIVATRRERRRCGLGRGKGIQPKHCCQYFRLEPAGVWAISRFSDGPSSVRFPSDDHGRSTTDDTDPSSVGARRSDRAAGLRHRGCARPCRELLYQVLPPLFRWRVGNAIGHQRAPAALPPRTTKAPTPLRLRLLFFQILDSRLSPLFLGDRTRPPPCEFLGLMNCYVWASSPELSGFYGCQCGSSIRFILY